MAHSDPFTCTNCERNSMSSAGTFFQVSPPSSLSRIVSSAAIHPRPLASNAIALSHVFTGLLSAVQVAPPSRLRRIVPANPTIQPLLSSLKYTELSDHWALSDLMCCHVLPPSAVRRIIPAHPTAQP